MKDTDTSLSQIAKEHDIKLEELIKANPNIINPNKIWKGNIINLPKGTTIQTHLPPTQPIPNEAEQCFETPEDSYQTPWNREQQGMWYTPIPETNRYRPIPQGNHKPKMEVFARDVKNTYGIFQHAYTLYTFSDGTKIIHTGFPEDNNMATGNLKAVDSIYDELNKHLFRNDYQDKKQRPHIKLYEKNLFSDIELQNYLSKAREVITKIETGNNGARFDYDACLTDNCWGANSNTVQRLIHDAMGTSSEWINKIPDGVRLPGINGMLYDGLFDNFVHKYEEANKP